MKSKIFYKGLCRPISSVRLYVELFARKRVNFNNVVNNVQWHSVTKNTYRFETKIKN